jgi:site-specific recombinase XerD
MPDKFINLYDFIDFARANRKYPDNTANNLKSALKIFEKELNTEELKSIAMVEDSIGEIFRSLAIAHKDKSIISLNTYKARLLKVIKDYKKYGSDPSKMQRWIVKTRKSTPLLINKDKTDKKKIILSNPINTPVENSYKIEITLRDNAKSTIIIPKDVSVKEIKIIKNVIDSLVLDEK